MSDKVEQLVLLAKGLRGLALANLIEKATAEAGVYTFGELLSMPNVVELERGGDHASAVALLRLFAYGTWADYTSSPSSFPASLSDPQQRKLKALTIASLASSRRTLPYNDLMKLVDIETVRELEDLIISDCMYAGCLRGKLDQRNRCLHVEDALARDVPLEGMAQVIESLERWLENAEGVTVGVDAQVKWAEDAVAAAEKRRTQREKEIETEKEGVRAMLASRVQHDNMAMNVDEGDVMPLEGEEGDGRPSGMRSTKRRR